ncbi:4Fe-4S binding protein [Leptothermofonsia sichuanensis E412]|jgi:Fe-S-cluster-containing dehydrogenase component|uniref:4Fe-4S binding protein n=1 Tax=Leptothermofonsia sichuanensis TaxID=2917832 RepID=UPI001CA70D54|nr:4Fe-4S binding protein [Leptothermofonsia sichuanensis]QZZ18657.1 4Fe-4S binding protein [Leptothermofonsia sichuanensis E412]
MTYIITSQCIECHRCESVCPTGAITRNEQQYQINSERCNDCVGHYTVPQCWAICPTNGGCIPDLASLPRSLAGNASSDYWDNWFTTYEFLISRLKGSQQTAGWQRWFEIYSQALSRQLHTPTSVGVHP